SGTITLTTGQLTINTNAVTIVGPGSGVLTVSGNNAGRVFEVDGVNATIGGLTITGGLRHTIRNEVGGGIYVVGGGLTLTGGTQVVGNQVVGGAGAPGFVSPYLTYSGDSGGSASGAGLYAVNSTVTLTDGATVSGNQAIGGKGGDGGS